MDLERALHILELYSNGNITHTRTLVAEMTKNEALRMMAILIQYMSESGSSSHYSELVRFAGSVCCWT